MYMTEAERSLHSTARMEKFSVRTVDSAIKVFRFLRTFVDTINSAGVPQCFAPVLLSSYVERYAERERELDSGQALLNSLASFEDFSQNNRNRTWPQTVNSFLLSVLTISGWRQKDLQKLLATELAQVKIRKQPENEPTESFLARVVAKTRLFPSLDQDEIVKNRLFHGPLLRHSSHLLASDMESLRRLPWDALRLELKRRIRAVDSTISAAQGARHTLGIVKHAGFPRDFKRKLFPRVEPESKVVGEFNRTFSEIRQHTRHGDRRTSPVFLTATNARLARGRLPGAMPS
jgi:hypothetical protein